MPKFISGTTINKKSEIFSETVADLLQSGRSVRFSAPGNSMHPTIKQGDMLIIEPCDPADLSVGNIALYKDGDRLFAHRIIRIYTQKGHEPSACPCHEDRASKAVSPLLESCCRQDAPKVQRSTKRNDLRFVLRGDFRPNPDPPVTAPQILGKVVSVERNKRLLSPYSSGKRLFAGAYRLASQLKSQLPT